MDDEKTRIPDEEAFLSELRRFSPAAPPPHLRARIFGSALSKLFRLSAAAAVLMILCQALGIVNIRSTLPARFVIHDTLIETGSSLSMLETRKADMQFFVREEN